MSQVTLQQYLILLTKKLCANQKEALKAYCEVSRTDITLFRVRNKQPFAALYEPVCLENLSQSSLIILLLPYSTFLQQQLKHHHDSKPTCDELSVLEKQTREYAQPTTRITKEMLMHLCGKIGLVLHTQMLESLRMNTVEKQIERINTCISQGLQLINQLLPNDHFSKFILAHLGDLYINLMLLTDLTHKSVLKKQMQMICHQLSSFQKTSGSYGHFFNQRPLSFTQQLRIIRLEDTHGHSKLASDRINYLLGPE